MSRSWKQERTTRKDAPVKPPRPRMSEFAAQVYADRGYDTVTSCGLCEGCDSKPCEGTTLECERDVYAT